MLIAVNYHYVRPDFSLPHPGVQGLTLGQFEAQLHLLSRAGQFVSLEQVRSALNGGRLHNRAILITFDDGLREQFEHAWPILQRLGVPAAFFVNTIPLTNGRLMTVHKIHFLRCHLAPHDFEQRVRSLAAQSNVPINGQAATLNIAAQYPYDEPDIASLKYLLNFRLSFEAQNRIVEACFEDVFQSSEGDICQSLYMDRKQIHELMDQGCVGSHSHDHLPLGLLPPGEAENQLRASLSRLEEWTGRRPFALSYPYGMQNSTSLEVQAAACKVGFNLAFTMERARNDDFARPLSLARFDCNDAPGGKACSWAPEEFFDKAIPAKWYR